MSTSPGALNTGHDRQQLVEAIAEELVRHGLDAGEATVSLRSYGGTDGEVPALMAFVRLNAWKPEVLLRGKIIERRIREALLKTMKVRIGYVYWRIGSDVETPHDKLERFHVRAEQGRIEALLKKAEAAGAIAPANAPLTNWSDLDDLAR